MDAGALPAGLLSVPSRTIMFHQFMYFLFLLLRM